MPSRVKPLVDLNAVGEMKIEFNLEGLSRVDIAEVDATRIHDPALTRADCGAGATRAASRTAPS
jgi:hypothetical protein